MKFLIFSLIFSQLSIVAFIDFKTHKISNIWTIINACVAGALYLLLPDFYNWSWEVLLFPVGFIVFGFLFFLAGIMGAGDSKYLASLFILLPFEYHAIFFEQLIISTIVVGAVLIILKAIPNLSQLKTYFLTKHWQGFRDIIRSRISYAPVMLLAWILMGAKVWF